MSDYKQIKSKLKDTSTLGVILPSENLIYKKGKGEGGGEERKETI